MTLSELIEVATIEIGVGAVAFLAIEWFVSQHDIGGRWQ